MGHLKETYCLKKLAGCEALASETEDYILHFYNTRRYRKRPDRMTLCEYFLATAAQRKITPCCEAGGDERIYSINGAHYYFAGRLYLAISCAFRFSVRKCIPRNTVF